MSFAPEKRAAAHLLAVVENGSHSIATIRSLYEDADSALVYLIFSWLRVRYHAGHSASEGVLGRIAKVCGTSAVVARKVRQGERDAIVVWFEGTYEYRELDRIDFISLVVEKLEG